MKHTILIAKLEGDGDFFLTICAIYSKKYYTIILYYYTKLKNCMF